LYSIPGQIIDRLIQRSNFQLNNSIRYYRFIYLDIRTEYSLFNLDNIIFSAHSQEEALLKIRQYILSRTNQSFDIIKPTMLGENSTVDEVIDALIYDLTESDSPKLSEVSII
jgi:hypothetical protein